MALCDQKTADFEARQKLRGEDHRQWFHTPSFVVVLFSTQASSPARGQWLAGVVEACPNQLAPHGLLPGCNNTQTSVLDFQHGSMIIACYWPQTSEIWCIETTNVRVPMLCITLAIHGKFYEKTQVLFVMAVEVTGLFASALQNHEVGMSR